MFSTQPIARNNDFWDGFLEEVFNPHFKSANGNFGAVDLYETKDSFVLETDMPGVDQKDIKVEYKDKTLSIEATRKRKSDSDKTHLSERSYGIYKRSFSIGREIDETQIHAQYKDGTLRLVLPKSAKETARLIPVK